ncbi:hypothetical protein [Aquimarina algiphila]|uniref:hypothetical protein n=1 Tax=Aquimarina algiphila TaxID=2047982 RepID=UPI002490F14E|nr:hypothetical protein [Aquimarina algiphila]
MNRIIILLSFLTIAFLSCKTSKEEIDQLEIAKQYFKVLDNSDYTGIKIWFADSLITKEGEYKQVYSQNEYLEFLKWDSVFDPNYEILEIEQQDGIIKAKISKMDKRIFFLHEEPFITNQSIRFQKNKIVTVEIDYVNFNEKTWEKNKTKLLTWIDENHPELNGFIYDQTETGGIKFLKAIELYKNRK